MIELNESEQEILIALICYKGFKSIEYAMAMENMGLAKFTGNQHNESWAWDYDVLKKLTVEQLTKIYNNND